MSSAPFSNVIQAANTARAFCLAADRCSEARPLAQNQFESLAVPAVVCHAFAIELGLKALILQTGAMAHGHDLAALFSQVPRDVRHQVFAALGLSQATVVENANTGELACFNSRFAQLSSILFRRMANLRPRQSAFEVLRCPTDLTRTRNYG